MKIAVTPNVLLLRQAQALPQNFDQAHDHWIYCLQMTRLGRHADTLILYACAPCSTEASFRDAFQSSWHKPLLLSQLFYFRKVLHGRS